jgi:hypothetical protein
MTHSYDVIEVDIKANKVSAILAEKKSPGNAEAVVEMAVMRRGCFDVIYDIVMSGKYRVGDERYGKGWDA